MLGKPEPGALQRFERAVQLAHDPGVAHAGNVVGLSAHHVGIDSVVAREPRQQLALGSLARESELYERYAARRKRRKATSG